MNIIKGKPTDAERRAIELALSKVIAIPKRVWATPALRKEMPSRWR